MSAPRRLPAARVALAWLTLAAACAGPSSRDYREDRQALTRVLAADAHTAQLLDPLLDRLGSGRDSADTLARLDGEVAGAARRAERLARAAKARTPEGRALRDELVQATEERGGVVAAFVAAARSGRPEELLEAIRAARELEERLSGLDERVEALAK